MSSPIVQTQDPPTPTPVPAEPIVLDVFIPLDDTGTEVNAVTVLGRTSAVKVEINGLDVEVAADGSFQKDLPLIQQGSNRVTVVAFDAAVPRYYLEREVFLVTPTAGLPFTLFYPPDGLTVSEPVVQVIGVTKPGAVVGINEIPVEPNELGIFSGTAQLEEGANLIEIVAANLRGNVRFQTVVVFYQP